MHVLSFDYGDDQDRQREIREDPLGGGRGAIRLEQLDNTRTEEEEVGVC